MVNAMAQVEETVAFDSPSAFALRVKYEKHTLFIPVEPSTSYETLATRSIALLSKSEATPPEEAGYSSFEEVDEEDTAFFTGSTKLVGGAEQEGIRFVILDRSKKDTIAKMGFKDGADAVTYLSFRAKGSKEFPSPNVSLPPLIDEDEGEDPDAIPPPLDDEDATM